MSTVTSSIRVAQEFGNYTKAAINILLRGCSQKMVAQGDRCDMTFIPRLFHFHRRRTNMDGGDWLSAVRDAAKVKTVIPLF
jgi:hypothetical protein